MSQFRLVAGFLSLGWLAVLVGCGDSSPGANSDNRNADQSFCGNGLVEAPEECDDGNQVGDDGCSESCMFEPPFWREATPASSPPARLGASMAYDPVLERVVLFGGTADGTFLGDTWTFDGHDWIEVTPTNAPTARAKPGLIFDEGRGRIVLFGGFNNVSSIIHDDVWAFDEGDWQQLESAGFPIHLEWYTVTYSVTLQTAILFGVEAHAEFGYIAETWAYGEPSWSMILSTDIPPGGVNADMANDTLRGRTVIFGGDWSDGPGDEQMLSDTWEFDGTDWIQNSVSVSPPARLGHSMAFDRGRGQTVLFGGSLDLAPCRREEASQSTWEYDGTDWSETTTSSAPPARCLAGMAYHDALGGIVLFGGGIGRSPPSTEWDVFGDTWVYR